jgi:elongation factor G
MHAGERKILDAAGAGEIVAVVGPKQTLTGDTLCDTKKPVVLPSITFPQTVISMSIEPKTAEDRAKLAEELSTLRREDPTFEWKFDAETGQTIISGMGELHLEILEHKLVRERGVNVRVGKPKVAYKEAITTSVQAEGKFIRQTGGRGQYGHVVINVEPIFTEDGHWKRDIEFENEAGGDKVPKEYVQSVERGVRDAFGNGVLAGYPVVGIKVTLVDGSFHSVDSSSIAFEQGGAIAVENALKIAGPVLLEPVMKLEVEVPDTYFGVVQSNLLAKRGFITDTRAHGNMRTIDAMVPLAEMFGYSSQIRSATAGRGTFTMEPMSYERVPEQIAQKVIS